MNAVYISSNHSISQFGSTLTRRTSECLNVDVVARIGKTTLENTINVFG